jgi:hypothetical protein
MDVLADQGIPEAHYRYAEPLEKGRQDWEMGTQSEVELAVAKKTGPVMAVHDPCFRCVELEVLKRGLQLVTHHLKRSRHHHSN